MRQVLFVDDEVRVLQGLERMLRVMRHEWEMTFLDDPKKAVDLLSRQPFDAIVVDMRMPELDGNELLTKARELRPDMARIVLSGHAERQAATRSVAVAHQFLAKPCDADTLKATVARACELRSLLADAGLADTVCRLGKLPSLPELYSAITKELAREDASLKRVAEIIDRDIAMTAKVLQLVNSAFFGLGRRVSSIEQAVAYLGVDVIRSLVLTRAAFDEFDAADAQLFAALWQHSCMAAALARRLAEDQSHDRTMHAEAFQAAMLHDIGALVFASRFPEEQRRLRSEADPAGTPLVARERSAFGCDHAKTGAYLLGLWGLSDAVVEAIAHHEEPSACGYRGTSPLAAVHVASALIDEALGRPNAETRLDMEYLEALEYTDRLSQWREHAQRVVEQAD